MAPSNWLILFIFFTLIFILFINFIYFQNSSINNLEENHKKSITSLNWKW
uniref:ATP synthase F0 subunit 8 n=2 Tax=Triops cancriformis TaxID=194544 RepID=Q8HCU9_TRICB|nr:ATP synthase F0 subunit 8 [Triops cancriformis]QCZ36065.1 ATP synthase F0 subunit 8 [Triops cancriformis]QCZ36078.1 ATP synthase F0 subunit 8 [Triops cancriformis]BAC53597.1 ATPase subunit 8 [Triops cancriformis]